jgi:hypothetical protein
MSLLWSVAWIRKPRSCLSATLYGLVSV